MDMITILYLVVSLLYLYTGIRALVLNKNNGANRLFVVMTGCLFIHVITLLLAGLITNVENILIIRALGRVAGYVFYSAVFHFALCVGEKLKTKRLLTVILSVVPVLIDIYLYIFLAPEIVRNYNLDTGTLVFEWTNQQGLFYQSFLAIHIITSFATALFVFWGWGIKNRNRHKIPFAFLLNSVFVLSFVVGGYLGYKEHFWGMTNLTEASVIVFSLQVIITYLLIVKNEFVETDVSASIVRALELMQEGFLITSEDYIINRANEGAEKISGFSINQLYGKDARLLFENMNGEDAILLCADGSKRNINLSETEIVDPATKIGFRIISFRDIEDIKKIENQLLTMNEVLEERVERRRVVLYTIQRKLEKEIEEKKELEEELSRLVYYDMLTELPNRVMFNEKLQKIIRREQMNFGILAINIDNFKRINDTIGHNEGDRILVHLSELIQSKLRTSEMAARMEGDEFLILVNKVYQEEDLKKRADQLQESVKQAFYIKNLKIYLTMSIGAALYLPGMTASELIYNANVALYGAKRKGISGFESYCGNGRNYLKEKIKIRQEIEQAIRYNEFELYYQPQVLTENEKVSGAEALLRWNHPEKGFVMPGSFIPQIENENLIIQLGEWVVENACRQIKEWEQKQKYEFLPLSVNLSMRHFESEEVIYFLKSMIEKYEIDPAHLKIEITESFYSEELYTLPSILAKIRENNISLSVDDFGTGYSSFHYLKNIKADVLKIPREYVIGIGKNKKSEYIVKSMIDLAHELEMMVIAEGVESAEEKEFLTKQLCDVIQGYYYFKPMNKEALESIS
ncbi:EAL domain-containing protein [Clostridiales bacterium COT073_COT-073]|nr:EAL domain-containing protein [Clostridiales bacterium COT073_COT-073]